MTPPDDSRPSPLKGMDGEPVFDEPWQAQVLAIADALVTKGDISASDWSNALGRELKQAEQTGGPDDHHTYYQAALRALETLLAESFAVTTPELEDRRSAWARAYEATPHGEPVELANADR